MTQTDRDRDATVLGVLAPARCEKILTEGLTSSGISIRFTSIRDRTPESTQQDPYGLEELSAQQSGEVDGLLLVAPRNRSPRRVVPKPVLNKVPIGVAFANTPDDLEPWITAVRGNGGTPTWAVLAMWRRSYLSLGQRVIERLRRTHGTAVEPWFADRIDRTELCERFATGPRLIVYLGHGRARGLSGYLGLRWRHVADVPRFAPTGTFLCFACDTLKRERNQAPFGCRWISEGRAAAFVGCTAPIPLKGHVMLVNEATNLFDRNNVANLGDLLTRLDRRLRSTPSLRDAQQAFAAFRVVGNPVQSLL